MQNAEICVRIVAERSSLASHRGGTQQLWPKLMQNAAIPPQTDAERNKLAPNLGITQSFGPQPIQNGANSEKINGPKTDPERCIMLRL